MSVGSVNEGEKTLRKHRDGALRGVGGVGTCARHRGHLESS